MTLLHSVKNGLSEVLTLKTRIMNGLSLRITMSNKIEKLEYLIRQCESIQVQIHDDDVDFKDYLLMRVIQMRIEFERQLSLANNEHKKLEQSY